MRRSWELETRRPSADSALGATTARAGARLRWRVLPILVAMALAWWATRRLGRRVVNPIPLMSLIATSLSMRLVFEEGLFPYKFMALAVMLVVLAVVQRAVRPHW